MVEKLICAGFGGQGVMVLGKLVAYAAMLEAREVSWLPSYGPEMRGGTANCSVVVSDKVIGSPVIGNGATCVIAMNKPSLEKFENNLIPGGKILINSSLVSEKVKRKDIEAFYIPANDISTECGAGSEANIVMLGAYLALTNLVKKDSIISAFGEVFDKDKLHLLSLHETALKMGADVVR